MQEIENEVLQNVGAAIAQEGIYVKVDIMPRNWLHKKAQQINLTPKARSFKLRPLLVANMYKVASRASKLPNQIEVVEGGDLYAATMPVIASHFHDILYIVAICLQNDRNEPTQKTIDFIKFNFTTPEIVDVLMACLGTSKIENFMHTIVLVKGTSQILKPKTSPETEQEIIARSE